MKQPRNVLQRITEGADLPVESLPRIPLVEIAGDCRVLVENHFGVKEYGKEKICVQLSFGQLCISGTGMELAQMTRHQLVICGRIDSVTLLRGRK